MASNSQSPSIQDIRDHARQKYWSKFDAIIRTLIAMDVPPTDLEQRLRSGQDYPKRNSITSCTKRRFAVLEGNIEQGEETIRVGLEKGVEKLQADTGPKSRPASKESGHNPTIKVEDEEKSRSAIDSSTSESKHPPAMKANKRKWKATEDNETMDRGGKRIVRGKSRNQPGSQQLDTVTSRDSKIPSSEAPSDANRAPTPAAHVFRTEGGVFVRPKVGWQFREFEGITKVWYGGNWRPLIQDQPSFKGVREAKGGWIVPIMARSKEASLEQRRRWEYQGRFEFNSQF